MGTVEKRGKNSWRISTQVKVSGSWQWVRMTLRMDPSLPQSIQQRDAERELVKLEKRLAGEVQDDYTLREWSKLWLSRYISQDVSPVTVSNYQFLLDSRILPALGSLHLSELSPAILSDWLYNLRKSPRKTTRKEEAKLSRPRRKSEKLIAPGKQAQPLSVKTAINYFGCMKTMLAAAVRLGLLETNPMDRVQRPKQHKKKKKQLPEEEVKALLSLIITEAPRPLCLSVLLAMLCSLRLGEVCALKYTAIDWTAGTIEVDQSLKYTPETGSFIDTPKTDAGSRTITLPQSMIRILREALWADVMEEQDEPEAWRGDRWIVHSRHGARVNKDTPSKWFRAFADAHGYKGLTFHGLRHIHASILLAKHVDLSSVSARMGHSDPAITLRAYADALPARDQDAAKEMDKLLSASL